MMSKKIIVVFIVSLVFSILNTVKASTELLAEETNTTKKNNSEDDEDESASIQVVQRDVVTDKVDKILINDVNAKEGDNYTVVVKDINSTSNEVKFYKNINSNSTIDQLSKSQDDNIVKVSISDHTSIEQNNRFSHQQEQIEIIVEDITKPYKPDINSREDNSEVDEDESDGESAENFHSDKEKHSNEAPNIEISIEDNNRDFSVNDYVDKKISLELRDRMETRNPDRREHINTRQMIASRYGPPEDHGILEPGPIRSFSEIMVPRYRPVLTRSGIVFSPTILSMQTGSPFLDRLTGRNWVPNRAHNIMNPELETFPRSRQNIMVPHHEDMKMIDDYNDYGSNTYSYTPVRRVTTQAPPQQIIAPNKLDVFQKLVEASNHPKSQKRMFNDFSGNFNSQRHYPENYRPFDLRRVRRHTWDEVPFQDN